jgi:hypothetical protein
MWWNLDFNWSSCYTLSLSHTHTHSLSLSHTHTVDQMYTRSHIRKVWLAPNRCLIRGASVLVCNWLYMALILYMILKSYSCFPYILYTSLACSIWAESHAITIIYAIITAAGFFGLCASVCFHATSFLRFMTSYGRRPKHLLRSFYNHKLQKITYTEGKLLSKKIRHKQLTWNRDYVIK